MKKSARPDLTERKRRTFIHEQDGAIRLIESEDQNTVFLDSNNIEETHATRVMWKCESCGELVSSFITLCGMRLGLPCNCAVKWSSKIKSEEFWEPGSNLQQDVRKSEMILKIHGKGRTIAGTLRRWLGR